jgi:hypothetical protein
MEFSKDADMTPPRERINPPGGYLVLARLPIIWLIGWTDNERRTP